MFRELRRKKKAISLEAAKELLASSRRGILAVNGDDGYPYAIPINYLYDDEQQKIFFHSAGVTRWSRSLSPIKCALRYTVTR